MDVTKEFIDLFLLCTVSLGATSIAYYLNERKNNKFTLILFLMTAIICSSLMVTTIVEFIKIK